MGSEMCIRDSRIAKAIADVFDRWPLLFPHLSDLCHSAGLSIKNLWEFNDHSHLIIHLSCGAYLRLLDAIFFQMLNPRQDKYIESKTQQPVLFRLFFKMMHLPPSLDAQFHPRSKNVHPEF